MGTFSISVESPAGSNSFVPTGKTYNEANAGYIGQYLIALEQQTGVTFAATLLSGSAITPPANVQQPTSAHQSAASSAIAAGIANGADVVVDALGNFLVDPSSNLLANC